MYFTILSILLFILFIVSITIIINKLVIGITVVVTFVSDVIKDQLHWMEVEKRCNLNTQRRLAQVLEENVALKAMIQESEEMISRCGKLIIELQRALAEKELEASNNAYEAHFNSDDGMPIPYGLVVRCNEAKEALAEANLAFKD